ncbi:MAG: DMT family transporter [Chloroflexota bacterium]
MTLQALPYILLLGFLFGSTLIASRFSVGQYEPTTYIGLRLLLASFGHITVYLLSQQRRWPADRNLWGKAAIFGVFGTALPMAGIVTSLLYLSSGVTAILLTTGPAMTVLLAHFFLPDETLTTRKSIGISLAMVGALILTVRGETGLVDVTRANPTGYVLVISAVCISSIMTIYARKYLRSYDAFDVATIRMVTAASVLMPLSIMFVGFDLSQVTRQGYFALIYAGLVGTFAGLFVSFYINKNFGATAVSLTQYILPIVATIGGVLILGETMTIGMVGGMGIIAFGLTFLNQRPHAPNPRNV